MKYFDNFALFLITYDMTIKRLSFRFLEPRLSQQHNNFHSELTNSINITMNPVDGKCYDANNSIIVSAMQNTSAILGCSSSEGSRSAGDGGSESNYATVNDKSCQKPNMICDEDEEEEEEESHYSLIRKPDGQADEANYNTLR